MPHSQPDNHPPLPLTYSAASARPKLQRPEAVSVLAFIGVLVGSAMLFCNVIAMAGDMIFLAHPERSTPMKEMTPQDPMVLKIGAANAIAGVIFGAILLGGCLAAISLRRSARRVILAWSVAFILCGVARTIGEIKYVGPANLAWVQQNKPDEPSFASGQMASLIVPKAIGALALYCVLPVLFFTFWTRPNVKQAFDHGSK